MSMPTQTKGNEMPIKQTTLRQLILDVIEHYDGQASEFDDSPEADVFDVLVEIEHLGDSIEDLFEEVFEEWKEKRREEENEIRDTAETYASLCHPGSIRQAYWRGEERRTK